MDKEKKSVNCNKEDKLKKKTREESNAKLSQDIDDLIFEGEGHKNSEK